MHTAESSSRPRWCYYIGRSARRTNLRNWVQSTNLVSTTPTWSLHFPVNHWTNGIIFTLIISYCFPIRGFISETLRVLDVFIHYSFSFITVADVSVKPLSTAKMRFQKSHNNLFRYGRSGKQRHLPVVAIQWWSSENFQSESFQRTIATFPNSVDTQCRRAWSTRAVWHLVATLVWKSFRDRCINRIHSYSERILSNEVARANTASSGPPHRLGGFTR